MAGGERGARAAAGRGRAARRHRALRADARPRGARLRGPRAAAGDPLERPAHRRRVRGDRGDARARAADRADGQPRAARASPRRSCCGCAPTSPTLFARIARIALPKDYVRLRLCGEHATDVADASGTLLLDVAERRWSEEMLDALDLEPDVAAARAREPAGERRHRRRRAGRRGRRRPGGRRARRGRRPRPGPDRSVVLGHLRRRVRGARALRAPIPRRACTPSATRCPATWHAMGVMLSAAGSLQWLQAILGADYDVLTAEASAWEPATEGLLFLPVPRRRAHPARRSRRARRLHRPRPAPRPRGARARAARGGRLRPARLARPDLRARRTARRSAASPAAARTASEWLRIIASVLELPLQRVAVEDAAAFGAALLGGVAAGVWPDVPAAVAATVRPREADRAGARVGRALPRRARALPRPLPGIAGMPLTPPADAAIFDFDGVIIDSLAARRDRDQRRAARARLRDRARRRARALHRPADDERVRRADGRARGLARRSQPPSPPTTSSSPASTCEQTRLVDGIAEVLDGLTIPLALATAKERRFVGPLLERFGLRFDVRERPRARRAEGGDRRPRAARARRRPTPSSSATASTTSTPRARTACA